MKTQISVKVELKVSEQLKLWLMPFQLATDDGKEYEVTFMGNGVVVRKAHTDAAESRRTVQIDLSEAFQTAIEFLELKNEM